LTDHQLRVMPLGDVREAAGRAQPYVQRTPVLPCGDGRWLKLELLQPTGSFKVRGFFAAALALSPEERSRGLLTVSAGNAAVACAYVAHQLGVPCRVVMFDTAPAPKLEGVRRWGAEPILKKREDLLAWLAGRCWEGEPETFIHPFKDRDLRSGHGGVGVEIAEQVPGVQRVVVAVGGGGLITGVASAIRQMKPEVEVVGVQSSGYPLWPRTFAEGTPPQLTPQTIADGTAAPYEAEMHQLLTTYVDGWLTVPEAALRSSIARLAIEAKVVAEGAGALAYAALDQLPAGPTTVAIISGGNIARDVLSEILTSS
jgi:threonine dehydratase